MGFQIAHHLGEHGRRGASEMTNPDGAPSGPGRLGQRRDLVAHIAGVGFLVQKHRTGRDGHLKLAGNFLGHRLGRGAAVYKEKAVLFELLKKTPHCILVGRELRSSVVVHALGALDIIKSRRILEKSKILSQVGGPIWF